MRKPKTPALSAQIEVLLGIDALDSVGWEDRFGETWTWYSHGQFSSPDEDHNVGSLEEALRLYREATDGG